MSHFCLLYIVAVFLEVRCDSSELMISDFMYLHCRDNYDVPVDWWYIYKPPGHTGPYFESGANFTYLLPSTKGRWEPSHIFINAADSMLRFTLAPLHEKLNKKTLAVMAYGERGTFQDDELLDQKSTAYGVLIANSEGGIWIGHTVPGFPIFSGSSQIFPNEELGKGHMLMCINVDLATLNAITAIVRHTEPNILKFTLPDNLMVALPEWTLIETAAGASAGKEAKTKLLNFETRGKSLQGIMLARSPEDTRCLYKTFAKLQGVVMDVYSNAPYKQHPICEKAYSLRHIDSISIKFPEQHTYYINNKTDRTSFAVNTAAVWQRSGRSHDKYWTCAGNIDQQSPYPSKGGLIACVNHYFTWLAFDNLKVKEPTCE